MKQIPRFIPCAAPECRLSRGIDSTTIGCRILFIGALAATLATASLTRSTESGSPLQAVKTTVTELFNIVKGQSEQNRWDQRWDIEQIIRRHVSYDEMAKRSLGDTWTGLDNNQRDEFVGLFVQMLRDALANRLFQYSDEQMAYLSEEQDQGCAKVYTKLWGHKIDTTVEFRLKNQAGRWLLYDVVVDGVSIVNNYHAQFSAVMREVSYAGLIDKMKQRTLMVKMFEGGAP
ncbi:MAG: ABC transporter substrate-binding protein [Nitrospiraceae bacterium]